MKYFVPILFLVIIFTPTFNIGGIPLRIEDILMFVYLINQIGKSSGISRRFSFVLIIFMAFILLNFLSLLIAVLDGYASNLNDLNTIALYAKSFLFLLTGYYIGIKARSYNENELRIIFGIGIFFSAVLGVVQYFDFFGLGTMSYLLYGREERIQYGISRAIGSFGNPNIASYYFAIGFILFYGLNITSKKWKIYQAILAGTCLLGVLLTFSRTGLLALLIAWTAGLILKKKIKSVLILLFSIVLIFAFYFERVISGTRFSQIMSGDGGNFLNFGNRANFIWIKRLESFFSNPLLGTGPSKNRASETVFSFVIFDNTFLLLIVTSGILGLSFYLLLYHKLFRHFFNLRKTAFASLSISITSIMVLTFLFFFTTDIIWSITYVAYFYLLLGVSYSYVLKSHSSRSSFMME